MKHSHFLNFCFVGINYLQQFCASAVNAVVSPFVLYDIAIEAAHVLARSNPVVVQNHMRSINCDYNPTNKISYCTI